MPDKNESNATGTSLFGFLIQSVPSSGPYTAQVNNGIRVQCILQYFGAQKYRASHIQLSVDSFLKLLCISPSFLGDVDMAIFTTPSASETHHPAISERADRPPIRPTMLSLRALPRLFSIRHQTRTMTHQTLRNRASNSHKTNYLYNN